VYQKRAKLVAVVGSSNSGKTTIIEYVISGLKKKGFRVGSIKHIHHPDFAIDEEGTDTWRHARAGSEMIAAISRSEIDLIVKDDLEARLSYILDLMERDLDIILVEGLHSSIGKRPDIFKIVTAHDAEDLRQRLRDTPPPILAISGLVAERPGSVEIDLPIISSKTDGSTLVERIEEEVIRK
jgi:molybdopterin-guanine dinucleotide biosynthesis protein B